MTIEEITHKLAEMIGNIAFKLSKTFSMHLEYKAELLEFFVHCFNSKEVEMRRFAAFNLPCFN